MSESSKLRFQVQPAWGIGCTIAERVKNKISQMIGNEQLGEK